MALFGMQPAACVFLVVCSVYLKNEALMFNVCIYIYLALLYNILVIDLLLFLFISMLGHKCLKICIS